MVFSTRIFRNLDLGIEWFLRWKAIELKPFRCLTHICRYIYIYIYNICVCVCLYTYLCIYVFLYVYIFILVSTCIYSYTCTYIYSYIFIFRYMYICCILICRHNKDEQHSSLEKYTSHFIERVVCERELKTEQNCNTLTLTPMATTAFLSRSPGLLTRGPGVPASLGHVPHSSIFSPTCLNFNCSIGGLRAPLLGAGFLYRILSPTDWTSCALSYIIVRHPPSCCGRHKSQSFNPSTVMAIFWYSSTGCTCYLHWCISYFDRLTGSEVNIQHIYSYIYIHIYIYIYIYIYICYMHIYVYIGVHAYTFISVDVGVYIYINLYIFLYMCVRVCVHAYIRVILELVYPMLH